MLFFWGGVDYKCLLNSDFDQHLDKCKIENGKWKIDLTHLFSSFVMMEEVRPSHKQSSLLRRELERGYNFHEQITTLSPTPSPKARGEVRPSYKQFSLPNKQPVIQSSISILGAKNLINFFERVRERVSPYQNYRLFRKVCYK